jgi:hypothetical protein
VQLGFRLPTGRKISQAFLPGSVYEPESIFCDFNGIITVTAQLYVYLALVVYTIKGLKNSSKVHVAITKKHPGCRWLT